MKSKLKKRFSLSILLGLVVYPLHHLPAQAKTHQSYQLGEAYHLNLSTNAAGYARIELFWHDNVQEIHILANTDFTQEAVQKKKLCQQCAEAYIVHSFDRSSTYGATTHFIIDQTTGWWGIYKLPFDRAKIEDIDQDGIYEIINQRNQKSYHWVQGLLIES